MNILEKIKNNKKNIAILLFIMAVGIFLRTYKFHDWLRFSRDQARDAAIVVNALENRTSLPLLGPKAGGTIFQLGPAYYYLSYFSGKIFGTSPDKLAYPSLVSAILAIPLLFIFLRKYFNQNISLSLAAIFSVSYFFVVASRFSSNPNLIPFFLLANLYALLKIMETSGRSRFFWSVFVGIFLGIGIQTQTLFLFIMPALTALVIFYLIKNKVKDIWKSAVIIISLVLILNITQLISEFKTDWQNSKNFFWGFHEKANNNYINSVIWIAGCQIQANSHFISSWEDNYNCSSVWKAPNRKFFKNIPFYFNFLLGFLFSATGYFFLWRNFKKEENEKRRNFLGILILLNILCFLAFIFVAKIMSVEYFIMMLPIPFAILGLIFVWLEKKFKQVGKIIVIFLITIFVAAGILRNYLAAKDYQKGMGNGTESTTLEAIELISQYLISTSGEARQVYLSGNTKIASRFNPPLRYFLGKAGKEIILLWKNKDNSIVPGVPLYYIETSSKEIIPGKILDGHEVIGGKRFFRQVVYVLKN